MKDVLRVGVAVPPLRVADVTYNLEKIRKQLKEAESAGVSVLAFPELAIPGYTCGDLFTSEALLPRVEAALTALAADVPEGMLVAVGAPLLAGGQLFNCAVVLSGGKIIGAVPKTFIPNYAEFYERRWFSSARDLKVDTLTLGGDTFPIGADLLFRTPGGTTVGLEVCEDYWAPLPPSTFLAMNGAEILINLSASNETVQKRAYRRELAVQQSARTLSAYLYTSSGSDESTSDLIFSGHGMITLSGTMVAENKNYIDNDYTLFADLDLGRIRYDRRHNKTFSDCAAIYADKNAVRTVNIGEFAESDAALLHVGRLPFVPGDKNSRLERCMQIFDMQSAALARRLSVTGGKLTLGISGGLDSTLALLVAIRAMERLSLPRTNIIAVTMPCFGTSDETLANALELMKTLGVTSRTVPIREAVLQHFRDIGHDARDYSVTYENAQARERTQVLMDMANKEGGIVLGTGDLSELALGWCTYNADHMSMYGVNSGVPKTLVRWIISAVADNDLFPEATAVLRRVIDTPISPELLPPDAVGNITQKTEEIVGPYALHDFFLYYAVRFCYAPKKIFELALIAFEGHFDRATVKKWLGVFFRRFFNQQFKRNCLPDGVKIGTISLSPRGDWRMPADASSADWLREIEEL